MNFDSEEAQTKFYELPTQFQYDWLTIEELCHMHGLEPEITLLEDDFLEVSIRIDCKMKNLSVS